MPRDAYYLPSRRLVSQDEAAITQRANVPRSKFIGAWTRKTTFNAGVLIPFMVDEVLPGDHLTYNITAYLRMATPLFPMFDNQSVATFFFYVPCRLLWENWAKFMGEQANPTDSIAYTIPSIQLAGTDLTRNTLFDHMGLPCGNVAGVNEITVNTLPLRAYNKIWNAWFRDQNIQNSVVERTTDAGDLVADFSLLVRGKAHDYFTSALPWPQKFTAPATPLSGTAPVIGLGFETTATETAGPINVEETNGLRAYADYITAANASPNSLIIEGTGAGIPQIYADLSAATGVAINTFRQAFMVQTLLERDARGGTRYTELIRSHFGVINPDFRLQRPEYIGGGSSPLNITPVAQTAPTAGATVGALGAAATSAGQHSASYAATEHGYILGLINVRSELSYQQGLHKLWSRSTRYDFYWPSLASLGEQAVLRQEIYATGVNLDDETVFGYQERWHEYRTHTSEVTSYFRSTFAGTLDAWHLAQNFSAPPTLSNTFIRDTAPMERVLAAGALADAQQYLADILIQRTAVRPIPTFGTPATLGRF